MDKKIVVAIDGYSSCGKSTMAKALAREVGYIYVDTGAMYRGVALAALRSGLVSTTHIDEDGLERLLPTLELNFVLNDKGLPELYLNGENVEAYIRTIEVATLASRVAAIASVRELLVATQQRMGQSKGIVMDGRDIGTVVFPNAELKVFVTANPVIRAKRRLLELQAGGDSSLTLEQVVRSIEERDYHDTHREISPLRQASDALVLDNSHLTPDEQMELLRDMFRKTIACV